MALKHHFGVLLRFHCNVQLYLPASQTIARILQYPLVLHSLNRRFHLMGRDEPTIRPNLVPDGRLKLPTYRL